MKQQRCIVGGLLILLAFAALIAAFTLPTASIMGVVNGGSVYYCIANLEAYAENKELFTAIILFVAAAALLLFCCVVGVLNICKGEASRGVFFSRIMALLALICTIVSTVLFAVNANKLVDAGTIVPMVAAFVAFVGTSILPSVNKN